MQKIVDNLQRQTKQLKNISQPVKEVQASTVSKKTLVGEGQGQGRTVGEVQGKEGLKKLGPMPIVAMQRSSSQPGLKGKVCRGVNYDQGSLSIFTRAKLKDLENRLENAKVTLRQREMVARIVKQKIEEHLEKEECTDPELRKQLAEYDF